MNNNTESFLKSIEYNLKNNPDKIAFYFLDEEGKEVESITYYNLISRSKTIANELINLNATKGERVILLYEPCLEFISAFLGCLYAGAIAVPAYPPDHKSIPRLAVIAKNCDAKFALTSSKLNWLLKAFSIFPFEGSSSIRKIKLLVSNKIKTKEYINIDISHIDKDTIAFLQYTSGSTGNPKGVILNHENLLENNKAMNIKYNSKHETHAVFWLPFYHDMGLIGGIIHPLYCGGSSTLMSPLTFLKKPSIWLNAIYKFNGTHTAVPNFALEYTIKKISPEEIKGISLESLEFLLLGGEPVRKDSMGYGNENYVKVN